MPSNKIEEYVYDNHKPLYIETATLLDDTKQQPKRSTTCCIL